ncbi:MAG TPA: zinc ribbon domain-containing protein [Elusimicrobiota bacterium]|nr:zinc ribbon domain-containing protein [Elusimicrobiota bacterium]
MKCPSCGAPSADGAAECPQCGLVFAKWRERQEREKREAAEALKSLDAPPAPKPPVNPWIGRIAAAVIVVWWMLGLAIYYLHRLRRR